MIPPPSPNPCSTLTSRSLLLLLLTTLALLPLTIASSSTSIPRPPYLGPRDRFWRHHTLQQSLLINNTNVYPLLQNCLHTNLTLYERSHLSTIPTNRTIGRTILDDPSSKFGSVLLVEIINAMTPVHIRAVQVLARCIRHYVPSLYEARALYLEWGLEEDDPFEPYGGNNPTHLSPLIGIFLPEVVEDMFRVISLAYDTAGWEQITIRDDMLLRTTAASAAAKAASNANVDDDTAKDILQKAMDSRYEGEVRAMTNPHPSQLGFRASEHLTYDNFPSLADHTDGPATAYTVNYSFSNPEEYEGGYLYLIDSRGKKTLIKPSKGSCVVFLGGHTVHGVTEITGGKGGRREAFSTETWYNPDPPIGTTLWTTTPESMEEYVVECNKVSGRHWERGEGCEVEFSDLTPSGVSLDDNRKGNFRDGGYGGYGGSKGGGRGVEEKKKEEKIEKKEVKNIGAVKQGEEDQKVDPKHEETPNDQSSYERRETNDDYHYDYDYNEDYTYERPPPPEPEQGSQSSYFGYEDYGYDEGPLPNQKHTRDDVHDTRGRQAPQSALRPTTPRHQTTTTNNNDNRPVLSITEEPNFLIPRTLHNGEIVPLIYRDTGLPVKDDEAMAIGLPPELTAEFQRYIETSGLLRFAREKTYGEGLFTATKKKKKRKERKRRLEIDEDYYGDDDEEEDEHTLYKLNDNTTWGCMSTPWEGLDMVWIDPADEECFETLVSVLRRGNFDSVLSAIGEKFGLDGLMIQGIGPIFLSHFDTDPEYNQLHRDLIGAKGSFYNVVVPLHIPEGGAPLYVGDEERVETVGMRYGVGTLLGAESLHGTAECDYREKRDVRLSVAIYMADVTDENLEVVASDSTSLWPTRGDVAWFEAQKGRFWSRVDGSRSMRADRGRKVIRVEDLEKECEGIDERLCMEDPTGVRLMCPKTCRVYSKDDEYYASLSANVERDAKTIAADDVAVETSSTMDATGTKGKTTNGNGNLTNMDPKTPTDSSLDAVTKQIEWLRSKGGFFSSNIEYAPANQTDPNSYHVMVASAPIRKNEKILRIPSETLLTAGRRSQNMCDTARNLAKEYRRKDRSSFAPYVRYVFENFSHETLPARWSVAGKELFTTVFGRELSPDGFGENLFRYACDYEEEEEKDKDVFGLLETAYSIVVARSWNDVMVPVYDMFNHRNGHWHNVDQVNSAHSGEDISIVALRDIEEGEQLYLSYNECHDYDCDDMAHSYTLPSMVADYGFVEEYPRRFNFDTSGDTMVFELDVVDDENEEVRLIWISEPPDLHQVNWLRSHLRRLNDLTEVVVRGVEELPSHEGDLITKYYEALVSALEHAILFANPQEEHGSDARTYDNLEQKPDTLEYGSSICYSHEYYGEMFSQEYDLDEVESQYQSIEFNLSEDPETKKTDTCLRLSGWLQTCTSFRPHYHEALVHYPSSFLDTVKRVLFLGGGDNMILHEVLKYQSLELVVGMELDQQVVRSSFKNLGTQPHFDRDQVQWWFGDGSKSLLMLPPEYYGTFDLVLVDLQTFVVNSLKVTEDLSFMDVALLLLKPEGILVQNEDFVTRNKVDFAQYTVDLEFQDVPVLCQQSINMGSQTVDFFHRKPKDHGVKTIVFELKVYSHRHYDAWWNYRKNVQSSGDQDKDSYALEEKKKSLEKALANVKENSIGVMIILDVEGVTAQTASSEPVKTAVSQAIQNAGLRETSFTHFVNEDKKNDITFIAMQEGYINIYMWPMYNYVAFDLMLWSSFDKQNLLQAELVAAVNGQISSSYRIVTGGMLSHDVGNETKLEIESKVAMNATTGSILDTHTIQISLDAIIMEASTLIQTPTTVIAVLCADISSPCEILSTLTKEDIPSRTVIPLFACVDDLLQNMATCETDIFNRLLDSVSSVGKVNGIVIDYAAPRSMGQILYKIFNDAKARAALLADHYVVLAPTLDPSTSWRRNLLERFRTDIVKFSPAYVGDIFFNSTNSSLNLGIFSSGDEQFYSNLGKLIEFSEKKIGCFVEIRSVKDGIINYIPDFYPSTIVTDSDYDSTSAFRQWKSQRPLGHQIIFQFGLKTKKPPLIPQEEVLANIEVNAMTGSWCSARVIKENDNGTYDIIHDGSEEVQAFDRNLLRKTDDSVESSIKLTVGERVLIQDDESWWSQGSILQLLDDGKYKVQVYNGEGTIAVVDKDHLLSQQERFQNERLPRISIPMLKMSLQSTLEAMEVEGDMSIDGEVGDGCVITIFWSHGSIVMSWDGEKQLNVNLFTTFTSKNNKKTLYDIFIEKAPYLTLLSRDEQPRGIGRVVNFISDLQSHPHWAQSINDVIV